MLVKPQKMAHLFPRVFDIIKYSDDKINQSLGVCFNKIHKINSMIVPPFLSTPLLFYFSQSPAGFFFPHHRMTLNCKIIIQKENCSKSCMEPTMSAMERTSTFCFEKKKKILGLAICLFNPQVFLTTEIQVKRLMFAFFIYF